MEMIRFKVHFTNQNCRVRKDVNNLFRGEKILRKRRRNGPREVFVKWLGWSKKFNSWILEEDIADI
jgi:predicted RNA binding protein with dsRBD fold (UPF0201 family)